MSIAGSPVGVEDAAATLERAGQSFTNVADSIASHARAVTAHWVGSAADAAFDAITALANRTRVGADVVSGAAPLLRVYAAELRAAQDAYEAAAASAAAGAGAVQVANAQQDAATAMPTGTPQQRAARQSASAAAQAAATRAADQVTSAGHTMVAAVARAERANQVAADAIDALTAQLADMNTSSAPAPAPPAAPPPPGGDHPGHPHGGHHGHPDGGHHGHHGWVYNAVGGFGDGAWKLGPGAVGDLVGLIPTDATHDFATWVDSGHDALERDYGADTDSGAYRATSTTTQIAGLFIPGEGWVKGAEAATKVKQAAEVAARVPEELPRFVASRQGLIDTKSPALHQQISDVVDSLRESGAPPPGVRQGGVKGRPGVWTNRDRDLLFRKDPEYYTESDVWPGTGRRDSERLIIGKRGEVWYSPDHYGTFRSWSK